MYEGYPSEVRRWIDHHGGLSERMIFLKGRELAAVVPVCGASASSAVANSIKRNQLPQSALAVRQVR
jgi:hypothetical protein